HALRPLHDLEWILHLARAGVAPRHAVGREVNALAFEFLFAVRCECQLAAAFLCAARRAATAASSVSRHIDDAWMIPDSSEVRLAVRQAGDRLRAGRHRYQANETHDSDCNSEPNAETDFHFENLLSLCRHLIRRRGVPQ